MARVLLIGNGINRLGDQRHSWSGVLASLANKLQLPPVTVSADMPFPLTFERIVAETRRRPTSTSEHEIKRLVSECIGQIPRHHLYDRVAALPIREVLTTNYDYALEGFPPDLDGNTTSTAESLFSMHRFRRTARQRVWHIHGEAAIPGSLLLGHDHYVRYAARIRDYLLPETALAVDPPKKPWTSSTSRSPRMRISRGSRDYRYQGAVNWVDLLLTAESHVLALGLDYSEITLWWLIVYRSKYLKKNGSPQGFGCLIVHDATPHSDSTGRIKSEQHALLRALGAEVHTYDLSTGADGYAKVYEAALDTIGALSL